MPRTTLHSKIAVIRFILLLILSAAMLLLINKEVNLWGYTFEIQSTEKFQYQLTTIGVLSTLWFGLLAVKRTRKAVFIGLAVALINSFASFQLIIKIKEAYGINLPFDILTLSSCIIMVFVLNKRYFSRLID
jgi:hypothetical protein